MFLQPGFHLVGDDLGFPIGNQEVEEYGRLGFFLNQPLLEIPRKVLRDFLELEQVVHFRVLKACEAADLADTHRPVKIMYDVSQLDQNHLASESVHGHGAEPSLAVIFLLDYAWD